MLQFNGMVQETDNLLRPSSGRSEVTGFTGAQTAAQTSYNGNKTEISTKAFQEKI